MSGHSKWATTHRQKEIVDAKRGAIFTKFANIITLAARRGGDPEKNPGLRAAVDKARGVNMPKDNIERAIKKGTGELAGAQVEELYYEALGPGSSQFVVKCVTDNKNRSSATVRHSFAKHGGSFGAVLWNFSLQGVLRITQEELKVKKINPTELELELIDQGLDDSLLEDEGWTLYSSVENLLKLKNYLEGKNIVVDSAEIEYVAKEKQKLNEEHNAVVEKIIEELEDNEDVGDYYTNLI